MPCPLSSSADADHGRLGDRRVVDQRALDLHRADAVAGHVQHVVDAAQDPEVAVLVALGAVAGEVACRATSTSTSRGSARRRRRCVRSMPGHGLRDRPGSRRSVTGFRPRRSPPRRCPGTAIVPLPGFVGVRPGSGVIMMAPVSVCHHVSTIGQRAAADVLVVPHPRLRIDRLADRARAAAAWTGRASPGIRSPHLHERADRGRRGVEDRDAVLLDHAPRSGRVG